MSDLSEKELLKLILDSVNKIENTIKLLDTTDTNKNNNNEIIKDKSNEMKILSQADLDTSEDDKILNKIKVNKSQRDLRPSIKYIEKTCSCGKKEKMPSNSILNTKNFICNRCLSG